jgi:hypothetical protein
VQHLLGPHEGEKESSALAEAKDEPSEVVLWMEAQNWHVKTLKVLMGMSGDLVIEVAPSPLLDSQFLDTKNNGTIKWGRWVSDAFERFTRQDLIILLKNLSTLKY